MQGRRTSLGLYLAGTGSWFFFHGIQHVIFAWLVTMVLRESPTTVGAAQIALLLPSTLLMLVGGSVADRWGGQRVAVVAQSLAVLPPLALAAVLFFDMLSLSAMLMYAVSIGTLQAFVMPARDGLLNAVASGNIQRAVTKVTLVQFFAQSVGFLAASTTERVGAFVIVCSQAASLAIGAVTLASIRVTKSRLAVTRPASDSMLKSVARSYRTVVRNRRMRAVIVQNIAMGICFMGSYIVTIPLLIRDTYLGTAADLAMVNLLNCLGLILTLVVLLFVGNLRRQGRALLLANGIGAIVLGLTGAGVSFGWFLVIIFCWGVCGGVALSMSRTIMQEEAPEQERARVMAFFGFSFLGAGPVGALTWGFVVEWVGPQLALSLACTVVLVVVFWLLAQTRLWNMKSRYRP